MKPVLSEHSYTEVLAELKKKILSSRHNALITVNQHLLSVYWEIGNTILHHQFEEGWGTKVIDRISADLRKEFPEMKGFSVRNIKYMRASAKEASKTNADEGRVRRTVSVYTQDSVAILG